VKITRVEARPLRIAYKKLYHWAHGVNDAADVVLVCVHTDEGVTGYGESISCSAPDVVPQLLKQAEPWCVGQNPFEINNLLRRVYEHLFIAKGTGSAPRFGALVLAGLDMALWDLAGRASGRAVHELLGGKVRDEIQYFGFPQGNDAGELAAEAKGWADSGCEVIYVKVGRGDSLDLEIAARVRAAIGAKRLRLDANEAWGVDNLAQNLAACAEAGVTLVEQPLPAADDAALASIARTIPVCADESVHDRASLRSLVGRYEAVNIKLDKTGGLTEALAMAAEAERLGFSIMVGCMVATSLSMAPATLVAQRARVVDLDGPLLLARDREHGLRYESSLVYPPTPALWG